MGLPVSPRHFCWIGDLSENPLMLLRRFHPLPAAKYPVVEVGIVQNALFPIHLFSSQIAILWLASVSSKLFTK